MSFDTSVFEKEIARVFSEYRQISKLALPEMLRKRAIQLAVGSGKRAKFKGLFQEALALRPKVQAEIRGLPEKHDWAIKRLKGWTVKREIARRLVNAGRFQASGWLVPGFIDAMGEGSRVKTLRGRVNLQISGNRARITLTNISPNALEFGQRTGYIARAFYNQTQDMLEYIRAHLKLTAYEFNKKHPNFRQPIEEFIPSS